MTLTTDLTKVSPQLLNFPVSRVVALVQVEFFGYSEDPGDQFDLHEVELALQPEPAVIPQGDGFFVDSACPLLQGQHFDGRIWRSVCQHYTGSGYRPLRISDWRTLGATPKLDPITF